VAGRTTGHPNPSERKTVNRIKRTVAALVAVVMLSGGVAACGDSDDVDYPAPASWTVAYQGQAYCGYQLDAHEIDMYGNLVCTRVRFPSYTDAVVAGTLAAAMLAYLETYSSFYHSGYWYSQFYQPLGPRYHVTIVQRTTFINNSRSFDSKYASQIKDNSAKARWSGGKTGNYQFPSDNSKARNKGPLTNTNVVSNNGGRVGGDAGTSRTKTGSGSGGKTGTKPGTTRVGGRR
jgi:hypothetical protein